MIQYFDELDSTNAYCLSHLDELSSGDMIAAGRQTAGRGRRGRQWMSAAEGNVYASLLLKVDDGSLPLTMFPQIAGVAVNAVVQDAGVEGSWVKWPNDVFVEDRKLSGILVECGLTAEKQHGIVIGVGINIDMTAENLSSIDRPATSVLVETGRHSDLKCVLEKLHEHLLAGYQSALEDGGDQVFHSWSDGNPLLGRKVTIQGESETTTGVVESFQQDGQLILRTEEGVQSFLSGDVSLSW